MRGLERELTWFPLRLPRRVRALGADVLHCPMPLAPAAAAPDPDGRRGRRRARLGAPGVVRRARSVAHARFVLAPALRRAAAVLVPSAHTRERLLAAVRGLAPERVHVTPWGIDARFSPGPAVARSRSCSTVGTLQPRKNLEAALRAFERLDGDDRASWSSARAAGASTRWRRGWRPRRRAARIDVLGRVDDDELLGALPRPRACLLFPSRGEGFGFPPLEAMACGTPVVAAAAGSLPEVLGRAAPLVDPDDADALAAAVERVLADPSPWRERGLARAAGFTWERCAELTVAAYAAAR